MTHVGFRRRHDSDSLARGGFAPCHQQWRHERILSQRASAAAQAVKGQQSKSAVVIAGGSGPVESHGRRPDRWHGSTRAGGSSYGTKRKWAKSFMEHYVIENGVSPMEDIK